MRQYATVCTVRVTVGYEFLHSISTSLDQHLANKDGESCPVVKQMLMYGLLGKEEQDMFTALSTSVMHYFRTCWRQDTLV